MKSDSLFSTSSFSKLRRQLLIPALAGLLVALSAATNASAASAVTLTYANGVANPPANLSTTSLTPPQVAIADKATLVASSAFAPVLQSVLNAQNFSSASNYSLVTNAAPLDANATFNLTTYALQLNSSGNSFAEIFAMTLSPNLARPANIPAGATATLHWLQYINTSAQVNNYGYAIDGLSGFYQVDNGQIDGDTASSAINGPYYDSNAAPGTYSTPPTFRDSPHYYGGVGTYLHFTVIPTWDIYTPAAGATPSSESIDVANYGVSWGFTVVPEPMAGLAVISFAMLLIRKRRRVPNNLSAGRANFCHA